MKPSLYEYQKEGVDYLLGHDHAVLGDDMGLGKTPQAIVAARIVNRSTLVIAPASAIPNWKHEWSVWGAQGMQAGIMSYTKALRYKNLPYYETVILDEAHYCKNKNSKRTIKALAAAMRAKRAWLLTGTLSPNANPLEIWPIVRTLWPEIPQELGILTSEQWLDHFSYWRETQYGPRPYKEKNADTLRTIRGKIMLRRTLSDVSVELPPLRVDLHRLPADADLAADEEYQRAAASDYTPTSRLRRLLGSYKAKPVGDLIAEELETGQYPKIVVMAYHHDTLDILKTKLEGFGLRGFRGGVSAERKQKEVDDFTNRAGIRVLLVQQTAGGTALNMQASTEIALVEPSFVPDENTQIIKRIHRIGSTAPCRARLFAVDSNPDTRIMASLATKLRMKLATEGE